MVLTGTSVKPLAATAGSHPTSASTVASCGMSDSDRVALAARHGLDLREAGPYRCGAHVVIQEDVASQDRQMHAARDAGSDAMARGAAVEEHQATPLKLAQDHLHACGILGKAAAHVVVDPDIAVERLQVHGQVAAAVRHCRRRPSWHPGRDRYRWPAAPSGYGPSVHVPPLAPPSSGAAGRWRRAAMPASGDREGRRRGSFACGPAPCHRSRWRSSARSIAARRAARSSATAANPEPRGPALHLAEPEAAALRRGRLAVWAWAAAER